MKHEVFPLTDKERQRYATPEYFSANWRDTLQHAGCVIPISAVCVTVGIAVLYNAHYLAGAPIWLIRILASVLIAIGCLVAIKLPFFVIATLLGGRMRKPRLSKSLLPNAVRDVFTFTAKRVFWFDPSGDMPTWLVETTDNEWLTLPVPQEHCLNIPGWEPSVIRYEQVKGWYHTTTFCWPLVRSMQLPEDITFSGLVESGTFQVIPNEKITPALLARLNDLQRQHETEFPTPPEGTSFAGDSPLSEM
ncbi:MAG: hypothetical protein U0640_10995 [Phycisphaerales bacterium]